MTLSEYLNMLFPFFGDREGFGKTPKTKKAEERLILLRSSSALM